jgi:hypothetical protein
MGRQRLSPSGRVVPGAGPGARGGARQHLLTVMMVGTLQMMVGYSTSP